VSHPTDDELVKWEDSLNYIVGHSWSEEFPTSDIETLIAAARDRNAQQARADRLEAINAELLAACKVLVEDIANYCGQSPLTFDTASLRHARAAIALAEKG